MTAVPVFPRSRVLQALRDATTTAEAAKSLGLSVKDLRDLAYRLHMAGSFVRLEKPWKNGGHPGFKSLQGVVFFDGAIVVLERVGNAPNGNARWRVKFTACGHLDVYPGIQLRNAAKKSGTAPKCRICRKGNAHG